MNLRLKAQMLINNGMEPKKAYEQVLEEGRTQIKKIDETMVFLQSLLTPEQHQEFAKYLFNEDD